MTDELGNGLLEALGAVRRLYQHVTVERVTRFTGMLPLPHTDGSSTDWDADEKPTQPIREIAFVVGDKTNKAELAHVVP